MRHFLRLYIFISFVFFLQISPSYAQPPKRAMPRLRYNYQKQPNRRIPLKAKLHNVSFQRTGTNRGVWRGLITGNGNITLRLNIFENGVLYESKYIGEIQQKINESPTPFKYISSTPPSRGWTWKITATAK